MRMLTAMALGSVVVLTGCATRRLSSKSTLPLPRVVSSRTVSAPTTTPRVVRRTTPRVATSRTVTRSTPTRGATASRVTPPAPPSMELLGSRGRSSTGPNLVVPVSRSGRVQPAVAAPMVRTPAPAPVAAPAVAAPRPTRARTAPPCRDVKSLFQPAQKCTTIPVSSCPGGT